MTVDDDRLGNFAVNASGGRSVAMNGPITEALTAHLASEDGGSMSAFDLGGLQVAASELAGTARLESGEIAAPSTTALVGKVQSGKTTGMAMAIAALADSGVNCFIVLTGTKTTLTEQTTDELSAMFEMNIRNRPWIWSAPTQDASDDEMERAILHSCSPSASSNSQRSLLLICCMKEDDHLARLIDRLKRCRDQLGAVVRGRFVIFDDEGDQASADTSPRRRARPSTINDLISQLNQELDPCALIPVTATPQALLVQERTNSVRPNGSVLLEPGASYVGGEELFVLRRDAFVRVIPDSEQLMITQRSIEPPATLLAALATFLLTVELIRANQSMPSIASMLIHPHQQTQYHSHVRDWVNRILDGWYATAMSESSLSDEEMFPIFLEAARDVWTTSSDRVQSAGYSIEGESLESWIRNACQRVRSPRFGVRKVSDRDTFSRREWNGSCDTWIFIGGEVLGRGFVVKGLITTYMPRDVNDGNAYNMDTLQQRARFFGYKRAYADLLRGWFKGSLILKFADYVDHEEYLWKFLEQCRETGIDLSSARAVFELTGQARATRSAASRTRGRTRTLESGWLQQRFLYSPELSRNESTFRTWTSSRRSELEQWSPPEFTTTPDVMFDTWNVDKSALSELLGEWRSLSIDHAMMHVLRSRVNNSPDGHRFRVIDMESKSNRSRSDSRSRLRSQDRRSATRAPNPWDEPHFAAINNLHSNPVGNPDDLCRDGGCLMTIQVHIVEPRSASGSDPRIRVGAIAVYQSGRDLGRVFSEAV